MEKFNSHSSKSQAVKGRLLDIDDDPNSTFTPITGSSQSGNICLTIFSHGPDKAKAKAHVNISKTCLNKLRAPL